MPDTPVGQGNSPDYPLTSADLGADIYCKVTRPPTRAVTANADSNTVGPRLQRSSVYSSGAWPTSGYWFLCPLLGDFVRSMQPMQLVVIRRSTIRNAADLTTTTINILSDGSLDVASVPGSGGPFPRLKAIRPSRHVASYSGNPMQTDPRSC